MSESEYKLRIAQSLIGRGKVSRRDFIHLGIAAGLTVAAADQIFVTVARAQPQQGGFAKLGMAHGATTDSIDPAGYPDTFTQTAFSGAMSNGLTEVDAKGDIQPDLAESFESSNAAKTWVFKLRKGVTFHNGKNVTAEDVVTSMRYHMGADTKSAAKSLLESVSDIKADGPETVVFTLNSGNADFPYIMSDYHFVIMPSVDGKADWGSGTRTGAFVLENFQPGVSAKLKRNPNYFKNGKPYLDEVEFIAITDLAARMAALSTGEVDYIGRADLKTLGMLKRNPKIEIIEVTGYGHYTLPMNVTMAPFDNPDVRMAMKWAINRQEIADKIFLGHATVANDNPIAPAIKFYKNPEPQHRFDPEKARHYLKKAGMEKLKVDLSVADAAFAGAVDAAALIRETAAQCGIDVNVVREAEDAYWDNIWLKKPWCASYWSGRATADWMFTQAFAAESSWNESFWKNPRFNELLVQARAETDEAKRADMYGEMQQLTHDDGGSIVLVFNNFVSAKSKKLGHGDVAPNWENDGLKMAERWWMAEA
ncbi:MULTISPECIES: ABC transporter substrate-binding protein [unclassified Mesorhizobium]|uniref:ABC transporter substrate-binding protein n=1 Tax=unclassified Mesorhizobium TaxID=325217 RepID=UPI000F74E9C4|nr:MULTISPECIES: ABC transporter substrate-binding protein [unclassified Mesorhizobium]AZO01633.1 ABC transporter substrate-binding protein [Mesorhizobium sp. M2A.F.Ca.ET.043.02.1.1]RUW42969.1 ABC transporter substrate-binding protein [Mesorhizobium sp. M2A.F.Ca.ET.015.02.1.1]RUW69431.1 ABC transporter substrate-binding protein [Mesorhizobium sp. M2A.F.Ca.ET.067.02.1.1]RVC96576.1 ABC transporter substrate-binding protein [Mesorhizobium sp. M2A.F.Ca.ET.017.03.2.1]RVD09551.1 ABC transporter subs